MRAVSASISMFRQHSLYQLFSYTSEHSCAILYWVSDQLQTLDCIALHFTHAYLQSTVVTEQLLSCNYTSSGIHNILTAGKSSLTTCPTLHPHPPIHPPTHTHTHTHTPTHPHTHLSSSTLIHGTAEHIWQWALQWWEWPEQLLIQPPRSPASCYCHLCLERGKEEGRRGGWSDSLCLFQWVLVATRGIRREYVFTTCLHTHPEKPVQTGDTLLHSIPYFNTQIQIIRHMHSHASFMPCNHTFRLDIKGWTVISNTIQTEIATHKTHTQLTRCCCVTLLPSVTIFTLTDVILQGNVMS